MTKAQKMVLVVSGIASGCFGAWLLIQYIIVVNSYGIDDVSSNVSSNKNFTLIESFFCFVVTSVCLFIVLDGKEDKTK